MFTAVLPQVVGLLEKSDAPVDCGNEFMNWYSVV
jgi:hypothetical protein